MREPEVLQRLREETARQRMARMQIGPNRASTWRCWCSYFERLLRLLRGGGLLLVDNTLWSGEVANPENRDTDTVAIREFNAMLHRDERVLVSLLPVVDGLALLLKR